MVLKTYSFDVIENFLEEAESLPYLRSHPTVEDNSFYIEEFFDIGKIKTYNVMGQPTVAIYLDHPISFESASKTIFKESEKYPTIGKIEFDRRNGRSRVWEFGDLEALDISEGRAFIRSTAGASLFNECWHETEAYNKILANKIGEQEYATI